MKRIVKGKIEKYYCDECGKNICDYVPKKSSLQLFGMAVPEYGIKKYCEYVQIRKVSKQADYCKECYNKINQAERLNSPERMS